jgi:hypothetical protein
MKAALITIGILSLLLLGGGMALKKQIEVNGAQREHIEQQATALKEAEKLRQEAEQATQQRDETLTQIKQANRRLKNEITQALAGDSCQDRPIPAALDSLLRERTAPAGKGLPTPDAAPGEKHTPLGW